MSDKLFIEISGSSNKAVSALDKVLAKLSEFQNKLIQATSKINQFNNSLRNIPQSGSLKQLASCINSVATALKNLIIKLHYQTLKTSLK